MTYSLDSTRSSRTPSQLVVELRAQRIVVCEANVERVPHTIRHVAFLPQTDNTGDATAAAVTALAEYCRTHKINTRVVTLLLPRSSIALKTLCVPPCPDAERPTLVRLAAAGRSTLPIDELAWGYLSADSTNGAAQEVTVASLPRRIVEQWQSALQSAGFTLANVSVTGLAIGQVAVAAGVTQGVVVHVADDECYVVAIQASLPIALTQTTLHGKDSLAAQIAPLVRRLPRLGTDATSLAALHVSGDLTEAAIHELEQLLADTCSAMDRRSFVDDPQRLAAHAWLAQQRAGNELNLLAPAHVVERRRWPSWARWTAAASVLLGVSACCYGYECHLLDKQIMLLKQQQTKLAQQIERGTPVTQAMTALGPSVERRARWGAEVQHLVEKLPDTSVLTLKQLRGEIAETNGEASLRITGVAQDSRHVTEFQQSLVDESGRADLFPHGMRPTNDVPGYGVQFDLELKSRPSVTVTQR